ncbi:MAG: relaxase domain-containing protein [bacterium]|nr:relaxase domain-containing protein [bacterium]
MVASVRNLTSASATADYLRRDGGYYTAGGAESDAGRAKNAEHRNGSFWHGRGAMALGLRPDLHVAAGKFESLLGGHVIGTGIRLGRKRDGNHEHRPGLDITFSAPKSVSLAALLPTRRHPHGDRGVVHAHDEAVKATLDWIEGNLLETRGWDPATRKRPRIKAPHMVAATFRHVASRNLDPQLHTHAVIANMTRDPEGRWRSIEATLLHRHARQIGAYYRNELSRRLMERGYDVRPAMAGRIPSFEIAGYGRKLRGAFSTRRREIMTYMAERGWDHSQAAAQMATLATRRRKDEPLRVMLETVWAERARDLGLGADLAAARPRRPVRAAEDLSALEIVARTAERLEERQSVFAAHDLETLALAHSPGRHTLDEIRQAVGQLVKDGHLVDATLRRADRAFVTDRTLKAERAVIAMMKAGLGEAGTLAGEGDVAARLAGSDLTEGQCDAVRAILLSEDRTIGVQGRAGTGKTTMLRQVRDLAGQRRIIGLAPSAAAARVLEREAGIHARTLQWFLTRCRAADAEDPGPGLEKLRELFAGAVVVLDEASMVSTAQMRSLLRIARHLDIARLVLVGDTGQLRPVDAGQPFRQLQEAGMTTARMSDIRRQRSPDLKAAVLSVLEGEPGEAVRLLGAGLVEVDHDDLAEKAARAWLELDPNARARTLLLAPTHALRADINQTVREGLAAEGVLRGRVLQLERLVGLGMTRAEKADVRNYGEGDVVVFHQDLVNYRVKADDACTVTGIEGDHVLLSHPDGTARRIRPEGNIRYRLEVYETRAIELQAGDRIRWTRNDKMRSLVNGEQAEIVAITSTRVRVRTADGSTLSLKHEDPQLRHIDHAWSSTVHGAQGSTADGVIAVLDSGHGLLTDQATFYVEISRARDHVMVLTDNSEQLIETLEANTGERATALEAVGVTPDELRASLPEKTMPRRPREETAAPEARHEDAAGALVADGQPPTEEAGGPDNGEGGEARDPRHDIEAATRRDAAIEAFDAAWRSAEGVPTDRPRTGAPGYDRLLESARGLLEDPDLPAAVRQRAAALVEADTAWRLTDARIEELHREADHLLHVHRDLVEAAGEACPVVETAGYADWITAVTAIEAAWREMSDDRDVRPVLAARPKISRAITACLGTFREARACDDASSRFEALRRAVHERAAAGNTIGFHVDGHDDLVRQARLLAAMKNVPEHVRSSAREVIAHDKDARDRQDRVLALAAEADRLLDSHCRLAARANARPAAELAGWPAWRERWLKARRQWRAMCKRPDLWQPHLDRHAGDVNERLERCERRALTDAAWARFAAAHRRIQAWARAEERLPFGMAGWHGLVTQARALLVRDDLPDAAAFEARGVLASDAEGQACREAIGRFLDDARGHTRRWRILDAEARDRSRHGRDTVITDLEGYRPLAAFVRELGATGRALLREERYRPHLDQDPAAARRISRALDKLERHRPFDRFLEVTRNLKALRRRARRDGVPAFHSEGYGAVFDDVRELAGDRDLPAAARRRLKPVIEEHADCSDECARIEARVKEMVALDREHRTLEDKAGQENVPVTLLDEWPRWQRKAETWHDKAQELLDLGRFVRHLSCQPALQERIEAGLADVAERLAAPDRDRIRIAAMVREETARLHGRPPGGAFTIAWHGDEQLVTGDRLRRRLAHGGSVQELVVVWPGVSGGRDRKDALLIERVGARRNADGSWKGVERVARADLARDQVHRATWSDERLRDAVAARERTAHDGVHRIACNRSVVAGDRLRWTTMPAPPTGHPGHDGIDPGVAVEPQHCEGVLLRIVAGKTLAEDLCTLQVLRVNGREHVHEVEMERRELSGRGCYRASWDDENERTVRMHEQTEELRERRRILYRKGPHLSM